MSGEWDSRDFRSALGQFATGVTIVTAQSEHGAVAITANSFASVSLEPPLVLWSPAKTSRRFDTFVRAEHFAIHILEEGQQALALDAAGNGDLLEYEFNEEGAPILSHSLARFECRIHARYPGGDHVILLGRVLRYSFIEGKPMVFSQGKYQKIV